MSDYHRNKHVLGELTLGEFMELVEIEGEYTLGKNWLPITKVRRSKSRDVVGIFMYSASVDPDTIIPLESKVVLRGARPRGDGGPGGPPIPKGPDQAGAGS